MDVRQPPLSARRKNLSRASVLALVFIFKTGIGVAQSPPKAPQPPLDRAAEEDAIREAVFRYRMVTANSRSVFLSINGKDPSDQFIKRFSQSKVIVKKVSQLLASNDRLARSIFDPSTGERTMVLSAGAIAWISATRAEVKGGMFCGSLCADVGVYQVEKRKNRWEIENYRVQMIS